MKPVKLSDKGRFLHQNRRQAPKNRTGTKKIVYLWISTDKKRTLMNKKIIGIVAAVAVVAIIIVVAKTKPRNSGDSEILHDAARQTETIAADSLPATPDSSAVFPVSEE